MLLGFAYSVGCYYCERHHQWDLNIEDKLSVNSFNSKNSNDNEGLGVLVLHVCACQSVPRC